MLKIGDFSRIARVSIRMLRHYDQLGLLKPAVVDPASGYRSYSVDQLPRLNRILFLKELGFSLHEIAELIDESIPFSEMKAMLQKRRRELEHEISAAQHNLYVLQERLSTIENENKLPTYDVNVKSTVGYRIAALRELVPHMREMDLYCHSMYARLYQELARMNIAPDGHEITFYHNNEYSETDIDMEVSTVIHSIPSNLERMKGSSMVFREVASEEKVAFLIYNGPFAGVETAIVELLKWVAVNGWTITGEVRELHLSGQAHPKGKLVETAVLELQVPVARKIDSHNC